MLKRTLVAALSLGLLLTLALPPAEAVPVISAGSATVSIGTTFTIPIMITGATDLTSWQFDLTFDPAIVHANSVTEGPFMSAFGATLFIPPLIIDNTTGLISGVADFYIDLPPLPSGDGVLANVEFTALELLSPGVSPLTFSNVFLNLSDQGFQITNGQISVLVPEPTTLLLLSTGLVFLGLLRFPRRGLQDEA